MPVNPSLQRADVTAGAPSFPPLLRRGGKRFEGLSALCGTPSTVLDIGCRDRSLERAIAPHIAYTGVDLGPPADVIASAEETLPFEDDSFDTVVFADVLEHLDRPHFALGEGIRVASGGVVIALPNIFRLPHRVGFLFGRLPTSKYDFGPTDPGDRHRWMMNMTQARHFAHGCAASHGWQVVEEYAYDGDPRRRIPRAAINLLARVSSADLWAMTYMARLEPRRSS